ncbi:carbohydrate porin [Enterovirga rhinocerotis]|uniref:carbohydrate porin n=1 Tax=Enterovirga rhinocerotis TaxID=1339210 RepID=UPI001FE11D8F|nr:carbohydrate porin [Enterovirga rhinocerotis]
MSSFIGGPALAQDASQSGAATDKPPSIQSSLGPFGDPGGWRAAAEARGLTINLSYTNEMLGNLSGGLRRHGVYAGKLEAQLGIDLGTMAGWQGLAFFANAFQIHDTGGLRDRTFGRLVTVSNIEAYPSTRLSEIWLEQKWAGDRFGLRIGQITADGEFFSADYGRIFLSNDWPTITGANLPAGGPAYPISTPGIRFRAQPTDSLTALFAIFNGDPGDQKEVNRDGLRFPLRDPALLMGEVQYRYGQDKESTGLAGTWRLGGYHRLGRFDDLRYDRTGLALLHPTSNGEPRRLRGMSGLYGVVDHQLWRPEGGSHEDGILVYGRLSASPSDRSHIDLWADGGLVFSGLVPRRPHDQFGVSFIYSRIGRALRSADRDAQIHAGAFAPIRSYEATFEATYAAQIAPGWVVQPDIQYVYRPAGGVENPYRPGTLLKGGFIVGLRSTLTY